MQPDTCPDFITFVVSSFCALPGHYRSTITFFHFQKFSLRETSCTVRKKELVGTVGAQSQLHHPSTIAGLCVYDGALPHVLTIMLYHAHVTWSGVNQALVRLESL